MTQYFEIRDDKILMLSREKFFSMTISEILKGSYIVKHDHDGNSLRYSSNTLAYKKSETRGGARWLHDLFSSLVEQSGISAKEALQTKLSTIIDRVIVQIAKEVFPGAVEIGAKPATPPKPEVLQANLF